VCLVSRFPAVLSSSSSGSFVLALVYPILKQMTVNTALVMLGVWSSPMPATFVAVSTPHVATTSHMLMFMHCYLLQSMPLVSAVCNCGYSTTFWCHNCVRYYSVCACSQCKSLMVSVLCTPLAAVVVLCVVVLHTLVPPVVHV
jgi:hypothetical protein